jgi:hypothetical protein
LCVQEIWQTPSRRENKEANRKPGEDKMNINISTTQWGDAKRSATRNSAKSSISISRNLIMASGKDHKSIDQISVMEILRSKLSKGEFSGGGAMALSK